MGLDYFGPILLSLVTCLNNVFGVSVPCGETYLAKNGHRCYPCSAGYYKVGDCMIDGEQSRCKPCGYREYLPTCDNSTQCKKCDQFCHGGQIEIKACTPTSNLKCQCKDGYYWKPDPDRNCIRHSKCIPGEGLKTKGTPYEDTICEPCKNGTSYSNLTSYNECKPCSVCNITQRSCNNIHDTVCGSTAKGTMHTPEADSDKSLVIALGLAGGVVFVGGVVVGFLCIRHRNIKDSLSNDTDLTVDASAVAPRTLPPGVDEEGNSNHLEEAEVDDMERCGDGSVNSLGQDREGVQCQRNSIENDSVDTERVVLDPVDLSDIVTAATEISRTEESRKSTFWFSRRLAHNTNEEFSETIDVVIENSGEDNEGKYQILKKWREATPNAQLKDVIGAMKQYNLNALYADLMDKLKDKNLLDTDDDLLDTEIAQNRNDNSLYTRNDLSVQDADIYIEENNLAYGEHLEMEDLKSFKCKDDDAGCIS